MNTNIMLITLIILLLGFFSSGLFHTEQLAGNVVEQQDVFTKHIAFRSWQTTEFSGGTRGDGAVEILLPGKPESCTMTGNWQTDNYMLKSLGRKSRSCHKAQGSFSSYIDSDEQYVVNDADAFRWGGETEPMFNPPAEKTEGQVVSMWTCDHLYYTSMGRRNYVRGHIFNFGVV